MHVVDQLVGLAVDVDQALAELVGVAGGEADALQARHLGDVFDEGGKVGDVGRVTHLAAVAVDVLAQQGDFLDALVDQVGHFRQHVFKRTRDFFTAGVGHHAIAAVF